MKKKITKKKNPQKKQLHISIHYIILAIAIFALVMSGKIYSGISKLHVLGASTGPVLLADHGGDSSGDSGDSSGSGSNSGSNSGSSSQNSGSSNPDGNKTSGDSGSNSHESDTTINNSVSGSTKVDCVGPDGKHFITEFHDCQNLNQQWGHSNFNFTPLAAQTNNGQDNLEPSVTPEQKDTTEQTVSKTEQVEVQTEGNKGELNLQSQGLQIEIKREDNGQVTIHAHQENGQEVSLKSDTLEQINQTLKDQEVEVSTTSADELAITSHNVAAHTTLPISIDPSTNTLAITTPAGTKDVAILPDKAVAGILNNNILSNVLAQAPTTSSESATTVIGLTTQNNEPVFQVQGVKEKHLLGIFPVAFQKTVTVSAQTGQVLNTQESLLNQILESLSI